MKEEKTEARLEVILVVAYSFWLFHGYGGLKRSLIINFLCLLYLSATDIFHLHSVKSVHVWRKPPNLNMGKNGPEKTLHLDIFHALLLSHFSD